MADLSDVEVALVAAITTIAYPNGIGSSSALVTPVKVFRGLPSGSGLLREASSDFINISVFPEPDRSRNTTRWGIQVAEIPCTPGITVAVQNNSATFQGTANTGDLAGVLVDGAAYVYAAQQGDASELVAAALADAVRQATICWLTGSTLTVPGTTNIIGRTTAYAAALEEWARQEQDFRVTVWAGSPQLRDAAGALIGAGLATMPFLTLADGTGGRLRYGATGSNDNDQASSIYQRSFTYIVEYGTTITRQAPTMLFGDLNWNGQTILA